MAFGRFIRKVHSRLTNLRDTLSGIVATIKDSDAHMHEIQEKHREIQRGLAETNQKVVFGTVGLAISAWAKMEEILVVMVAMLLRVPNEKAGLMMYSIINFNSWIDIINGLFDVDDQLRPLKRRWTKISEKIRAIKDQRDQIAHHPFEATVIAIKGSPLDIRNKTKKQQPLNANEISHFSNTVSAIANELVDLVKSMHDALHPSLPDKPSE